MNIDRAPGAVSKKGRMPITCICTTNTYNGKKRKILFQIYLIYVENDAFEPYIQVVHVSKLFPLLMKAIIFSHKSQSMYIKTR